MNEYVMVPMPDIYPQACVHCDSAKGPLVDTIRELPNGSGRGYICALCVKRAARALGLIKGPRMEQLLQHGELLDEAAKALAARDQRIDRLQHDVTARTERIEQLEAALAEQRQQTETDRHLREQTLQLLNVTA